MRVLSETAEELRWRREQYAHGVSDAEAGRQAKYANQFYQRGYRRGKFPAGKKRKVKR